jgi:hypothetical protein
MAWIIAIQGPGRAVVAVASELRPVSMSALSAAATTGAKAAHVWAPLAAAGIVAGLVALAVFTVSHAATAVEKAKAAGWAKPLHAPSRRGGLFHGYDRRWSTSKTMAALWTMVLAFMVVTEALIAISGNGVFSGSATAGFGSFMAHTLDAPANRDLYLVLLGGPYAAAVFAKTVVTSRAHRNRWPARHRLSSRFS